MNLSVSLLIFLVIATIAQAGKSGCRNRCNRRGSHKRGRNDWGRTGFGSGTGRSLTFDSGDPFGISSTMMDMINPGNIGDNLRVLTSEPHTAGTPGDAALADLIKTRFQQYGLTVSTSLYNTLLSYPNNETLNSVEILDDTGSVIFDSRTEESPLSPGVVPPFHAYSASGRIESSCLVFAGYGRREDFLWLESQGINLTGCIAIIKYGIIFRGSKVAMAADNGAAGVIMYNDPNDYAGVPFGEPRVYPETKWMPPGSVERGTIKEESGDPLTRGYPAYPEENMAFRYSEDDDIADLPKIPSQPISYAAAQEILSVMDGIAAPSELRWPGGLNVTYRVGPSLQNPKWKIVLTVNVENRLTETEQVFGILKGDLEPDRYVLIGNHRDAWVTGAMDPSSGTAAILEIARVMGKLVRDGVWRPRRTIIFCSWSAEEYGLIGSDEWVEQYKTVLGQRAVAYLNLDSAVTGNVTFYAESTPLMYDVIQAAAKKVKNPSPSEIAAGRETIYDTWVHYLPLVVNGTFTGLPIIPGLGSRSDYAPFIQKAGVTSADLLYTVDLNGIIGFPLYHTEHDTFYLIENLLDQGFGVSTAVARMVAETARAVTDPKILPFNVANYAMFLETMRIYLEDNYGSALTANVPGYDLLEKEIQYFSARSAEFQARKLQVDVTDKTSVRIINDQMMFLERAFLDSAGLPGRPQKKHVIMAETSANAYATGLSFPGLLDLLFEIDEEPSRWVDVNQHFSVILHSIRTAADTLRDVTEFIA